MHALLIGRRFALAALGIGVAVVLSALSGFALAVPGTGPVILALAGAVPGLSVSALVLLASPPPRTSWPVHLTILSLVTAAIAVSALGNAAWSSRVIALEASLEPDAFGQASYVLLLVGIVLMAGAIGLLLAQLVPEGSTTMYRVVSVAPAVVVLLLSVLPFSGPAMSELAIAVSNIALGIIFISPFAALSAYVVTNDKIRKLQGRAAEQSGAR